MRSEVECNDKLRREADILDRIENVKRLVQMETTLFTAKGGSFWREYRMVSSKDRQAIGPSLISDLREEIQLQLLSIVAMCYGDNPDLGEPCPLLEWVDEDKFRDTWKECLTWNI